MLRACALLLALAGLALARGAQAGDSADVRFSMLAIGDAGHPPKLLRLLTPQHAVGDALAASHRARPADLLLMLGDNFYPDGLRSEELVPRIAGNLVAPFCTFVDLSAPRSAEVADACAVPAGERRPIPIRAVLGNHDFGVAESPGLQRDVVPEFIANWRIEPDVAHVVEAAPGLSLVLFDSTPGRMRAHAEALTRALRSARGPWRVVVAHHPVDLTPKGDVLREALAAAGVPVQLWVAGHDHNLQVGTPEPPSPSLQIVSGAGSDPTPAKYPLPEPRFFAQTLGFARIDFTGERLVATLVATRDRPFQFWRETRPLTRWSVDVNGAVREDALD